MTVTYQKLIIFLLFPILISLQHLDKILQHQYYLMHSINIYHKIIYDIHTNNTHNNEIKTILDYHSQPVGW